MWNRTDQQPSLRSNDVRRAITLPALALCTTLIFPGPSTASAADETERIDHGDGTYSLPQKTSSAIRTSEGLTWAYRGQGRIAYEPFYLPEVLVIDVDDSPPTPLAERLLGFTVLDRDGAEWEVIAADESRLDPELVALAEAQIAAWTPERNRRVEVGTWIRDSYTILDWCDGDPSDDDVRLWDDESRTKKTSPFTDRQENAVLLDVGGTCSGMLLRSDWVLTAAHCVKDDNGNWSVNASDVTAYSVDGDAVTAALLATTTAYTGGGGGGGDWKDDWALVKLSSAFPTNPVDMMDLYGGDDDAYKDIDDSVHNLAYPAYTYDAPVCVANDNGTDLPGGEELYHQANAEVSSIKKKGLKYKSDAGPGASGSAYYFCPEGADDVCGGGEKGQVIGVHSGFWTDGVTKRHVGPKATYFRGLAISIMDSN